MRGVTLNVIVAVVALALVGTHRVGLRDERQGAWKSPAAGRCGAVALPRVGRTSHDPACVLVAAIASTLGPGSGTVNVVLS